MASSTTAGETTTYAFNALGERMKKNAPYGQTTVFHYGQNGELLYERDASGNTKDYVWLDGRPLARIDNDAQIYYYHVDHLGTPQAMTDAAGAVVWKADYEPFGKATVKVGTVENNLRFPGQYFDKETNLHYNYFRDYDPSTGRYITSDPIGLAGGLNTYAYVENNPVNAIDPTGLVKLYGSWCGPDWTGGFRKSYDEMDAIERSAALPPIDNLDRCCQTHDITYANCRAKYPCDAKARQQCFQEADRQLNSCSASTSGSSRQLILMIIDPGNGGNPNRSIEDYMRDSIPGGEDNATDCGCQSK